MPPRQNFPPADRPLLDDHQTLHQELCRHLTVMSGNLQLLGRRARRSTAVPSGARCSHALPSPTQRCAS